MDPFNRRGLDPISREIWRMKYKFTSTEGVEERGIEDSWRRVAKAIAMAERQPDRNHWTEAFYSVLEGFRFLPAGRILAGAGAHRQVTLFNCFVMGRIPDSLDGIFTQLKEAALTLQQGATPARDMKISDYFSANPTVIVGGELPVLRLEDV